MTARLFADQAERRQTPLVEHRLPIFRARPSSGGPRARELPRYQFAWATVMPGSKPNTVSSLHEGSAARQALEGPATEASLPNLERHLHGADRLGAAIAHDDGNVGRLRHVAIPRILGAKVITLRAGLCSFST